MYAALRSFLIASTLAAALPAPAAGPPVGALDVLTLNLRSRQDRAEVREPLIVEFLTRHRPDVVLLQEVGGVKGAELTQAHKLAATADYGIAYCYNPRTRRGLAVLSRYPVVDVVVEWLPRRSRPALGVVINVDGRLVSFVNVHLTPQMAAVATRKAELEAALHLLAELPGPAFIGGDFNFGDTALENTLLTSLVDVYRTVEPDAPGHTWDLRNPLARKNSYPEEPSRRLDRILVNHPWARVRGARIVLDRPVQRGVFASDHYGVLARIELFPGPNRARPPAPRLPGGAATQPVHQPRP